MADATRKRPGQTQRELLHHGGAEATWGNLGLWPAKDYAAACQALARQVGRAAGLGPGQRVLSLACGAGDELPLWAHEFGVTHVMGSERDTALRSMAQRFTGPAIALMDGSWQALGPFDAVVCVDAAYHFSPRPGFLDQAHAVLKPHGHLAFTDLVIDGSRSLALRAAARLCSVPPGDLVAAEQRGRQLQDAGFVNPRCQRLDAEVLGGFTDFVRAQRGQLGSLASGPGWRRVAVTAALVPPARTLGLGYALFSACRA